jgi:aryl-alcohol dehydrogenase-like predicted oxidoreductase
MNRKRIGRSGLLVSDICLGTMTFGSTCDEAEAFRIMDRSVEAGINFFDAAEVYPVPPDVKWVHATEEIIGRWLVGKNRDAIIIATKFCGAANTFFTPPVRAGQTCADRHHIRTAIEGSLRRLKTDYVDLYQTHWPDHDFPYEVTLEALTELVQEGKVRYVGSSNETAWGAMKAQGVSELHGLVRYESIQNNFSVINRRFEDALAQVCRREQISLLPYSPIGGGVLSGKYNQEPWPDGCRFTTYRSLGERQQKMVSRFVNEKSLATVRELTPIAQELGISTTTLAVAWSKQHDFVASAIIGANTVGQLEDSLSAADVTLSADVLARIDEVTKRYPYPLG